MNVKPKFVYYDIRRKQSVCLIMYTHENDVDTQVLEVSMLDNGEPIELSVDYTYSAAIVNRDTKALINDNISCELNDSGNVLIPIDNFHTLGAQDLLIELTISDSAGNQVLVTPFPLWIHVNASILDDAQVAPESQGTVPELLEEAKEALENAGDYESIENKPQINGHELSGDQSGSDLGLQNKLTAGENVTIDENGRISASGGVLRYTELSDKPLIFTYNSDKTAVLQGILRLSEEFFISTSTGGIYLYLKNGSISFRLLANGLVEQLLRRVPSSDHVIPDLNSWKYYRDFKNSIIAIDDNASEYQNLPVDTPCVVVTSLMQGEMNGFQLVFTRNDSQPRMFLRYKYSDSGTEYTDWREIGEKGDKGDPGDAYVLTAQDKQDIADIVLSELPTTQGVLYGNANN